MHAYRRRRLQNVKYPFLYILCIYTLIRPQAEQRNTRFFTNAFYLSVAFPPVGIQMRRIVDFNRDSGMAFFIGNQKIEVAKQFIAILACLELFYYSRQIDLRKEATADRQNRQNRLIIVLVVLRQQALL